MSQENDDIYARRATIVVVIVIAGMLTAILLPAIQQAREAARRNLCMNNMKRIGLALRKHVEARQTFPAASNQGNEQGVASVWWPAPGSGAATGEIPSVGYTSGAGGDSATAGYSWIVMILPYLDEESLYNAISAASGEFAADAFTPYDVEGVRDGTKTGQRFAVATVSGGQNAGRHFAAVRLDVLNCPSFAGRTTAAPSAYSGKPAGDPPTAYGYPAGSARLGSPAQQAAITNYVALSATHFPLMQYGLVDKIAAATEIPKGSEAPNGMIVPGKGLNIKTCTDGTSKTLIICETLEPAMNCWYDGTTAWTTGLNPNSLGEHPPHKTIDPVINRQGFWMVPPGCTTALNVGPAPSAATAYSPALAGYGAAPRVISWGPSSCHFGDVVLHVAADGTVHIITLDVDPAVYLHNITRAGREPDSLPDTGC